MNRYLYFLLIFILPSCNIDKSNLISASDFNQMIKNDKSAIIIDVRTPEEFNKGHLINALNINWFDKNFDENINIFNTDLPVFVYCLSGGRSSQANEKIKSLGFKNVYELNGGILEWRKSKFPEAILNNNYDNSLNVEDFNDLIKTRLIMKGLVIEPHKAVYMIFHLLSLDFFLQGMWYSRIYLPLVGFEGKILRYF